MFKEAGLDPDKPPQTWAQLREYALKLTKDTNGDGVTDQWGFGYPAARFTTVAPEYLRAVMRSYGADILNEDMTACTIDTPEAIEAIRFYTDLVTKDKVVTPDIITYSDDDDWQSFGNQAQAMAMVGPWAVETYDKSYSDVNYGVATIPSNEQGVPGQFGLVHMGWMVSARTKHKKEVFDLIKFTLRPEVDAWFTDSTPAVKTAWENPAFSSRYKPEVIKTYKTQMGNSISSILLIPPGPQIAREVNVAVQRIILGMDAETVVKEAKMIIDDLLAE
jgi:multiple sugar transport system substrate-binding protein